MDLHEIAVDCIVVATTAAVVCACVMLHYEALNSLSTLLARLPRQRRRRVVVGIGGVLVVHIIEIWIFAAAATLLLMRSDFGVVFGSGSGLLDQVYLSAMTFTTVGVGDTRVTGPIRFLSGTEALCGLVLITWSASFTFLEMQRFWRNR